MLAKRLYEFGEFRLDPAERRLLRNDQAVALTPKCFDLLVVLVENSGHLLEKEALLEQLWPDQFVEEANLSFHVSSLRKVLGEGQGGRRFIETVPKKGFRFVARVEEHRNDETSQILARPDETLPESNRHEEQTEVTDLRPTQRLAVPEVTRVIRTTPRPWQKIGVLFITVTALATLGYALFIRGKQRTALPTITSIAVLPLDNLSHDSEQDYFADGITDTLIGDLAKISQLRVISRTSSMQYKGTKKSLPQIAEELKVDAVVEGTVQRVGERVRVRAQLIYAPTDEHLWVEHYDRDMRDIFLLQSEIAQAIARQVQITISPAEQSRLTSRPLVNPRAFDNYLQGRYLYWNKRSEENLNKAIDYFQSAIREDSTYALPYAGLADCYNTMGTVQIGLIPPIEARSRAEAAAVKALERDPVLAEAHNALGVANHYNWKWAAAEQEFKRAIELNQSYAPAHSGYASYLMSLNRVEESLAAANRSRELDPLSLSIGVQRGFLLENARRYDEAIEQLNHVIAVDQNHYQALWMLGHTYAANKQFDQAVAVAEKAVAISQRAPGALGVLGLAYGLAGRRNEANQVLNELLKLNERRYVTPAALVNVYIGLDNKDQAFVWLEKAYQERSNYVAYLKVFPIVDSLRSDPRFTDLVRRVGLPQ